MYIDYNHYYNYHYNTNNNNNNNSYCLVCIWGLLRVFNYYIYCSNNNWGILL